MTEKTPVLTPVLNPVLTFDIISLFPAIFDSFLRESLLGKAVKNGVVAVR